MLLMKSFLPALLLLFSVSGQAASLQKEPYSPKRFEQLQASGQVILIDIYAPWCPTCQKQQIALEQYRMANPGKQFTILEVDYDTDREAVKFFHAPRQSTLLIYRGSQQHWFSVAETRPEVIAAELNNAINYQYKAKYAL